MKRDRHLMEAAPADPAGASDADSADLFDWALIGSWSGFVLRSARRHRAVFALVFCAIVAGSLGAMAVLPKTWHLETSLQAQRNQMMAALSNPGRAVPLDADAPTRQAAETVLRHDNLVALIKQTDFVTHWYQTRAPALRVKDWLRKQLMEPRSPDEEIEDFADYLRTRLWVSATEGTLTFGLDFPDPTLGYHLVDTAVQNFLEARHAADVSSIAEAITILETRAREVHETLADSLARLQALREARVARLGKRAHQAPPPAPAVRTVDPETAQLRIQLQSKRRAIADLEEFRRRRTAELQVQLQEQRSVYADNHPNVLDVRQSLEAMQRESPQLAGLRVEEAALEAKLARRGGVPDPAASEVARATPVVLQAARLDGGDPREDEDSQIEYAKEQVRFQLSNYNSLLDRMEGARLELDSARAAFKYRYTVLRPVRIPKGPIKPKPLLIFAASLVAGFFLALFATALIDLRSRKILESWQIAHELKLPVLTEVRAR